MENIVIVANEAVARADGAKLSYSDIVVWDQSNRKVWHNFTTGETSAIQETHLQH